MPPQSDTERDFRFLRRMRWTAFCTLFALGLIKCVSEPDAAYDLMFYFYIIFSGIWVYPAVWNIGCYWRGSPNQYWLIEYDTDPPKSAGTWTSLITYFVLSIIMIALLFLVSFDPARDWTKLGALL